MSIEVALLRPRWLVVELPEDVSIEVLQLEDHELHSSRLRDFEVWGRKARPELTHEMDQPPDTSEWTLLGNFTAANVHSKAQFFSLRQPKWARFLLARFLSHYGEELNCCLTIFK